MGRLCRNQRVADKDLKGSYEWRGSDLEAKHKGPKHMTFDSGKQPIVEFALN